jgi:two-component system, OmpR family, response regulator
VDESLRILVVEDDPVYADFLARTLVEAGHDLTIAKSGAEARELARIVRPDAVLLDLGLPDEDGLDVGRALRNGLLPASSVIIVLTANMFPPREQADGIGVDMVLSKPVQAPLVIGMIDLVHARRKKKLTR